MNAQVAENIDDDPSSSSGAAVPSFSEIYDAALKVLHMEIAAMPPPVRPLSAQMANLSE